ncbi:MAG TPA: hypothetical protein VMY42_28375 [Thermoguttaceae bacterium]|nr:hypothetical protein [Thermoguttaceae bacterium]
MSNVIDKTFLFDGDRVPPLVGAADGSPWRRAITGAAPPTVLENNGFMELNLTADLENQVAALYTGDELPYPICKIQQVDFWAKLSTASLHAAISVAFGLCTARNDDPDVLAAMACFRCIGNNNVLVESDDGVNDNDDVATGQVLGTSVKRFTIDMASGLRTVSPGPSLGGQANTLFAVDDPRFNLQAVARLTTFDMSNYTGNLQLFAQIQKGAASSVIAEDVLATLYLERIRVRYRVS